MSGVAGDARQRPRYRQRRREAAKQSQTMSAQWQTAGLHRERPLTRGDVSRPCQPRWITRVDAADSNFRSAFADYLPTPAVAPSAGDVVAADSEFRPRLPTN